MPKRSQRPESPPTTREPAIPQVEFFWPRDLLRPSLPPCTVSTYSYPSNWTSGNSKNDLRKCGEQLLNVLYQDRSQRGVPERPLVLVGHSLGGLVIQQAFVVAKHNDIYQDIRKCVAGFIFLGSPMHGCDAASFAAWAQRAVGNDAPLLRSLKTGSDDLLSLLRDFWDGYGHLQTICFYEDNRSAYGAIKLKTVSSQSATPIGGRRLHLATDHSGLNKFYGPDDENFHLFLPALQEVVKLAAAQLLRACDATVTNKGKGQELASPHARSRWLIPFSRDIDFIDRVDMMETIDVLFGDLSTSPRVALSGLGGIGKSQVAIEYAYRKREQLSHISIFWVHASNPDRFRASYQAIASELRLTGNDDAGADHLDLVFRWFLSEKSGSWMLIIDNVDDIDFVRTNYNDAEGKTYDFPLTRYLPQRAGSAILLTSRDYQVAATLASRPELIIAMSFMTDQEAKLLIDKKIPNHLGDAIDRNRLLCQLECIPLAITQAAAYITRCQRMSINKYLRLFDRDEVAQASILIQEGADLRRDSEVPNSVIRTWEISFAQVQSQNELAAHLLSCIALFDRQSIPELLLRQDSDELEFDMAIETLLGFAFIRIAQDETMLSMHRLLHLATREWLRKTGRLAQQQEVVLKMLDQAYPYGKFENWQICQMLEPHAIAITKDCYVSDKQYLISASLSHKRAQYLTRRGLHLQAELHADASLSRRERILGSAHLDTLSSIHTLALVLSCQGRYQEAEQMYRRVLAARKRVQGPQHPDTLSCMHNLAQVLGDQGRYQEAEGMHREELAICEIVQGPQHSDTLSSKNNLALVLSCQGKHREAEQMYRQVLTISENLQGSDHPDTLTDLHNLALVLGSQGKHQEAEEMFRQLLTSHERVLGPEHPHTLTNLHNVAMVLDHQGKHEEAEEILRRLLATRERVLTLGHPDTLRTVWALAHATQGSISYDDTSALYRRATHGLEETLGPDHPDTKLCFKRFRDFQVEYGAQSKFHITQDDILDQQ